MIKSGISLVQSCLFAKNVQSPVSLLTLFRRALSPTALSRFFSQGLAVSHSAAVLSACFLILSQLVWSFTDRQLFTKQYPVKHLCAIFVLCGDMW